MTMHRRSFLKAGVAGMIAAATSSACANDVPDDRELASPALIGMMGPIRVRRLGAWYRQMVPAENDAQALRAALAKEDRRGIRLPWTKRTPLGLRVSDDFADGRTVLVDGWLLSRTEARQCALLDALSA